MAQAVRIKRSNRPGCTTGIVSGQTGNQNSKIPIPFATAFSERRGQSRVFHEGVAAVLLPTALVSGHKAKLIGFLYRRTVLKLKYKTAAEKLLQYAK